MFSVTLFPLYAAEYCPLCLLYHIVLSHTLRFTLCRAAQNCHPSSSCVKQRRFNFGNIAILQYLLFWENPNISDSKKGHLCFPLVFSWAALPHTSSLCEVAFLLLIRPESSKGFPWGLTCARMSRENRRSLGMVFRRLSEQSQNNTLQRKMTPCCLFILLFFHPFLCTMTNLDAGNIWIQ